MTKENCIHISKTLDDMAIELTNHNHQWTDKLRSQYEKAIKIISSYCKEID